MSKVQAEERYFDSDGNLAVGLGEDVEESRLKELTPESKVSTAPLEAPSLSNAGDTPLGDGEPKPKTTKKSSARTRVKKTTGNRSKKSTTTR